MFPEASGVWARMVAMWRELAYKVLVSEDGGLFEPIHAPFYFYVDITVGGKEVGEMVLETDGGWKVFVLQAHVLGVFHGGSKEEILEIGA